MSNERVELIKLTFPVLEKCFDSDWNMTYAEMVTDAILAAGYRKPHEVTTIEELNALPDGTLIGYHGRIGRTQRHSISALSGGSVLVDKPQALPAIILWEPTS